MLWEFLKPKFIQDENGLWYNERMERELDKKRKFLHSRSENAKKRYGIDASADSHASASADALGGKGRGKGIGSGEREVQKGVKGETLDRRQIPPAIEAVRAYCQERGRGVNPQKWWDFYQGKGWKIGKNRMVDWQAAVRTWEDEPAPKQSPRPAAPTPAPVTAEDLGTPEQQAAAIELTRKMFRDSARRTSTADGPMVGIGEVLKQREVVK